MLQKLGVTPVIAHDGKEAIQACQTKKFDLIFMDVQMPNLDGVDATNIIRRAPELNAQTPIVALSANIMPEQKSSYLRNGMTACLEKPLKFEALAKIMSQHIDDTSIHVSGSSQEETIPIGNVK